MKNLSLTMLISKFLKNIYILATPAGRGGQNDHSLTIRRVFVGPY